MNKQELVTSMSAITGLTKSDTEKTLKAFEQVITDELVSGGKVQLVGFLAFDSIDKVSRIGRNPRTGEDVQISARRVPRVKIGKTLKEAVNNK